ncbi:hypothetical protein SEA_MURP_64 [Gordonia phage Murp]|nr:hypothetical protein SEA_MURP_64 [Gordonia phage Murp]
MPFVLLAVANLALFAVAITAIVTGGIWLFIAAWALAVVEALSVVGWARLAALRTRKDLPQ